MDAEEEVEEDIEIVEEEDDGGFSFEMTNGTV